MHEQVPTNPHRRSQAIAFFRYEAVDYRSGALRGSYEPLSLGSVDDCSMTGAEDAKRRGLRNQAFSTVALISVDGGLENFGCGSIDTSTLPGCT